MAEADAGLELPIGLTEQKFLKQLARIEAKATKSAKNAEAGFVRANGNISKSFSGMSRGARGNIQNVSYQLQDIFVQISSGQGAARALSQQLPQLLGGFGALGAVFGVVAAAGIPLAANLFGAGEGADELKEKADALEKAMQGLDGAIKDAEASTDDLIERFSVATPAARDFISAILDAQSVDALKALDDVMKSISERFGDFEGVEALPGGLGLANQMAQYQPVMELIKELQIGADEALALRDAIEAVGDAKGPKDQAEAARVLAARMIETLGAYEKMTPEAQAFYKEVVSAGESAAELVGSLSNAESAAEGLAAGASNIAPAIDQASASAVTLASNLGAAMAQLQQVVSGVQAAQRVALATARIKLQTVGDPVEQAGRLALLDITERNRPATQAALAGGDYGALATIGAQASAIADGARQVVEMEQRVQEAERVFAEATNPAPASGGGGGSKSGGGGGTAEPSLFSVSDREIANFERQIELIGKSTAEVAALEAKWSLLDEAKRRGLEVDAQLSEEIDRQAGAVGRLAAEYENAQVQADFLSRAGEDLKSGLVDAIVEGENLSGVLEDLAKMLAKAALQAALFGADGNSGLLGGVVSAVFGGARAWGGGVRSGVPYLVNENTPRSEVFVPSQNGAILNVSQAQQALRGAVTGAGPQGVHVTVSMDRSGNLQAFVDERAAGVTARGIQQYDRSGAPKAFTRMRNDPRRIG